MQIFMTCTTLSVYKNEMEEKIGVSKTPFQAFPTILKKREVGITVNVIFVILMIMGFLLLNI